MPTRFLTETVERATIRAHREYDNRPRFRVRWMLKSGMLARADSSMRARLGMSVVVMFAFASSIGSARRASADTPARRCWAGDETTAVNGSVQRSRVIGERTNDRVANEIQSRNWSEKTPTKAITVIFRVDPIHNTFEFEHPELAAHGTGVLKGKPWEWTGYTANLHTTKGEIAMNAQLTASGMSSHVEVTSGGKTVATVDAVMTYFDCSKLDSRLAALGVTR
jgi:hypothetical protein